MRVVLTLAAGAALLVTAGCSAGQSSAPGGVSAEQPGTARAVSIAPVSNPPAPSTRPAPVTAPHTQQVVRRPVTRTGRAAPGFTVVALPADRYLLDCGLFSSPSPGAVDDGIAACGPSSAYALACWNGPTATTALCYRNPWQRQVDRINTRGPLPAQQAPERPTPLGLVLSDGNRCWLRDGGAWAQLDSHPELFGIYSCGGPYAVWGTRGSDGIDRTRALWSVRLAPMSGHGPLRTVTVRTAYFVGTSR